LNQVYQFGYWGGPKDKTTDSIVWHLGEFAATCCGKTQLVDAIDLLSHSRKGLSKTLVLMPHRGGRWQTEVHGIFMVSHAASYYPTTD